jgi:nitrogen fixation protein FixH
MSPKSGHQFSYQDIGKGQTKMQAQAPQRELTGRQVLFALIAFFSVVATVNVVMMRAAISTFGGVEAGNAYRAGLAFNRDIAAAESQDARHWSVEARIARRTAEAADLTINLREASGAPPTSVGVVARLTHPASARLDHTIGLRETAPGIFTGETDAPSGQWDLFIDVSRAGETLFRSKSRISLR